MSESDAAGRLIRMPGIVDAEATIPSRSAGVSRLVANGFRTGFFDIVELRIANKPIMQIMMKKALTFQFALSILNPFQNSPNGEFIFCLTKKGFGW
jgi:hypothetical protein